MPSMMVPDSIEHLESRIKSEEGAQLEDKRHFRDDENLRASAVLDIVAPSSHPPASKKLGRSRISRKAKRGKHIPLDQIASDEDEPGEGPSADVVRPAMGRDTKYILPFVGLFACLGSLCALAGLGTLFQMYPEAALLAPYPLPVTRMPPLL